MDGRGSKGGGVAVGGRGVGRIHNNGCVHNVTHP